MHFKRMEIQGFKSFADPVTIDLNDGITCIVGPNGSGKSNISDALRWVLGEQSPKQLRGGKMDDVIFAGTATRKPKGMAEVTLVIDNTSGTLPIEYNEVAVTRRMYRSGESEYLVNGNQCRMKDIKELFMDTGIGVDGYSIIGQGKIADIVSTKPENRREIFEEAAGVVLYKSRKSDAERKLQSASDNLERVKDIITEIEGRIGGLREESEKATEYIGLRDRHKHLEVNIVLHNIEGLERTMESAEQDLKDMENRYSEAMQANSELENLIEDQRRRESELSDLSDDSNKELLDKIEELHIITNRGQINTERLQTIDKDLERLNDVISDTETKLSSEKANFTELEKNETANNSELEETNSRLHNAVFMLNEHTTKASAVREEIEHSKERIIDLNNDVVSKNAEINTLNNYKKTLEDRKEQIREEYEGHDENDAKNREQLVKIAADYDAGQTRLDESKKKIDEIAENIISVNNSIAQTSSKIEETTIKYNRAFARKNTIEEMENNYEGYNNAVRALMQKGFDGIVGTVSDLITVPDGFELAVETALGGALQNIICDNDSTAKKAIGWLKAAKAGRATFLPVASVKSYSHDPDRSVTEAAGFLGIASDKVGCDREYEEILEYLLGRVILADDMDNAVRISKMKLNGFRIVTLDGEVINSSGAITGGKYRNKSANILERKKEIEDLSETVDKYKSEIERLKAQREEDGVRIHGLKEERATLYQTVQQTEIECGVLKSDKEHAESLVEETRNAVGRFNSEIETIESDISKAESMIDKYRVDIESAKTESADIENKVEDLLTDADKYREIVEKDNEEIVRHKVLVSEQETKILGLNELIERVRDTVTELETTMEDAVDERDDLKKQRSLLTDTGNESGEKAQELEKQKTELEERIAGFVSESDTLKVEHEKALKSQKESAASLEKMRDEKYKLDIKATRSETILSTQKDKLWDEFEMSYAEALDIKDDSFAITAGNKEAKEVRLRMAELGDVNISSIEEYKNVSKRYEFMTAQEADISKAMDELKGIISNMDRTIKAKFKENFDKVVIYFEQTFKELFGGGTAELRLEDENDPLESGIEIIAQPPGKKLKNINLMSGGEKTLTAIALMFAVLKAKPTPFCILDEVEAALDEANIERVSSYLKNFKEIQFTLITHQKATMEHADVLYGVTMPEQGISRMLSLKLGDEFDTEGLA